MMDSGYKPALLELHVLEELVEQLQARGADVDTIRAVQRAAARRRRGILHQSVGLAEGAIPPEKLVAAATTLCNSGWIDAAALRVVKDTLPVRPIVPPPRPPAAEVVVHPRVAEAPVAPPRPAPPPPPPVIVQEPEEPRASMESVIRTFAREASLRWIELVSGLCILAAMAIGVNVLAREWQNIPAGGKYLLGAGISAILLAVAPPLDRRPSLQGSAQALGGLGLLSIPILGLSARALLAGSAAFWPLVALSIGLFGVLATPAMKAVSGASGRAFGWTYAAAAFGGAFAWPAGAQYLHIAFAAVCFALIRERTEPLRDAGLGVLYAYSSLAGLIGYHTIHPSTPVMPGELGLYLQLAAVYVAVWLRDRELPEGPAAATLAGLCTLTTLALMIGLEGGIGSSPHGIAASAVATATMAALTAVLRRQMTAWIATIAAMLTWASALHLFLPGQGWNGALYVPAAAGLAFVALRWVKPLGEELATPLFAVTGLTAAWSVAEGFLHPSHGRFTMAEYAVLCFAALTAWPLEELLLAGLLASVSALGLALDPWVASAWRWRELALTGIGVGLLSAVLAHVARRLCSTALQRAVSWELLPACARVNAFAAVATLLLVAALPLLPFLLFGPLPPGPMGPLPIGAAMMAAGWALLGRLSGQRELDLAVVFFLASGAVCAVLKMLPPGQTLELSYLEPVAVTLPAWGRIFDVLAAASAILAWLACRSKDPEDVNAPPSPAVLVSALFAAPAVAAALAGVTSTASALVLALGLVFIHRAWPSWLLLYPSATLFLLWCYRAGHLARYAGAGHELAVAVLCSAAAVLALGLRRQLDAEAARDPRWSGRSPLLDTAAAGLTVFALLPQVAPYVNGLPGLIGLSDSCPPLEWQRRLIAVLATFFFWAAGWSVAWAGCAAAASLALLEWVFPRHSYPGVFTGLAALLAGAAFVRRQDEDAGVLRLAAFVAACWTVVHGLQLALQEPLASALRTAPLWGTAAVFYALAALDRSWSPVWATYATLLTLGIHLARIGISGGWFEPGLVVLVGALALTAGLGMSIATLLRRHVPEAMYVEAGLTLSIAPLAIAAAGFPVESLGAGRLGALLLVALVHAYGVARAGGGFATSLLVCSSTYAAVYGTLLIATEVGALPAWPLSLARGAVLTGLVTALAAVVWESISRASRAGLGPFDARRSREAFAGLTALSALAAAGGCAALFLARPAGCAEWFWCAAGAAVLGRTSWRTRWIAASAGFALALGGSASLALQGALEAMQWSRPEMLAIQMLLAVGLGGLFELPPAGLRWLLGRDAIRQLAPWIAAAGLIPLAETARPLPGAAAVAGGALGLVALASYFFSTAALRCSPARVWIGEGVLALLYGYLRVTETIGVTVLGQALAMLVAFALLELANVARRADSKVFAEPLAGGSFLLPIVLIVRALFLWDGVEGTILGREVDRASLLAMSAAFYGIAGRWKSSLGLGAFSLALFNLSLMMLLRNHFQLRNIDFYTIPAGASLLAFGASIRKDLTARQWENLRLVGLLCVYVAPAAKCLAGADPAEFWVLLMMGLAGFLIGLLCQLRNFFVFGLLFTCLAIVSQIIHRIDFSSAGMIAFFVLGVTGLTAAALGRRYREVLEKLAAELGRWE